MKNKRVIISFLFIIMISFVSINNLKIESNNFSKFDLVNVAFAEDGSSDGGGCCGGDSGSDAGGGGNNGGDGGGGYTPYYPPVNYCPNGYTNYPTCGPTTCSNGATNFPTCNNNVCTNGATNYPSCNNNYCTNGATNFPACNNNVCTNGATNFPACNNNVCTNGATNFPSCNNNVCINGATNYPYCNSCPVGQFYINGTCTTIVPTCTNGATNYPSCNNNVCSNGATNFPSCNNNVCTNGATNYPYCNNQCTQQAAETQTIACGYGQTGIITQTRTHSCPSNIWSSWYTTSNTCQNVQQYCSNGATNYPYCNNNVCSNGATNFPTCNNNITYVWCNGVQYVAPYTCPQLPPPPPQVWCNGVQYYAGYICPQNNLAVSTTGANPLSTTATINGYVNPYNTSASIWFDYGTSMYNLAYQTTRQTTSYSGAFNANLSGLACGTRYYYRAAAQNNVETKYGSTLSFVTPNCYVAPVYYNNLVITRLATKVGAKSAQLNGSFVNNGNNINSCVSFFDYGTNYNLSQRTVGQSLYSNYSTNYFSQGVFGLAPNTTYYYRAGVTCNDGTKYGQVYKFTTGYIYTYVAKKKVYNNVPKPVTIVSDNGKCNCDIPEYMNLSIAAMEGEATIGKVANYRVNFKNVSESAINNVVVRIVLPEELTILSADRGQFTKGGKVLTLTIPMLRALEEGSITISTNVDSSLDLGRQIVVNAYADYTTPTLKKSGNLNKGEVTAYTISVAGNGTSMNPSNGNNNGTMNSWIPQNFIEWIIFFVVFAIFLIALRYVFTAFSKV